MSQAPGVTVGRHLTPPCFCSLSIMGIKPRAERFLRGHLNLLDKNGSLKIQHSKRYHRWLCLSNEQKPQKSEGKIIGFFFPNSTSTLKQLQLKFPLSCTRLLLDSQGSRRSFPGLVGDMGTRCCAWRGEEPHLGTDPLEAALGLGQLSPGGQSGSRTDLAPTAGKGFPALAIENRVKKA